MLKPKGAMGNNCVVWRASWLEWPPHLPHLGKRVVPLDIWEQRLFLTLRPSLFKSHGKWITRPGFNSQSQEGGIYPFCFIFCGFWFNSMLWVALTAWSWWSCSSYKCPFLDVLTELIKLVHLFFVYVSLIPQDYGFSIHPSIHLPCTQQAFEWQPGARCCAWCCWPEDVRVTVLPFRDLV